MVHGDSYMHLDNLGGDDFVESVIGGEPFAAPGVGLADVQVPSPTESFSFRSFFGEPWLLFRSRYISAWAPPSTGHDTSYLRKPSRSADGSKRCLEICGGRHLQKADCASLDECSAAASFSALRIFHVLCLVYLFFPSKQMELPQGRRAGHALQSPYTTS